MARLTITLPDDLHRALKQSAARRDSTIGEIVAESLVYYGIKPEADVEALLAAARKRSGLSEEKASDIGIEETRAERDRPPQRE